MRYLAFQIGILWSFLAVAAPAPTPSQLPPVVPRHQDLVAVDYFTDGRQTGCGLRSTGEPEENVWLNVLVSVFIKETGLTFGIFKVSAKELNMKDGAPLLQNGRITYSSIGKIHKAWLKTKSGQQTRIYKNGELLHFDGYMASMEFASTMDLLVAIPQESFGVGIIRNKGDTEEIFEFDKRVNPSEASRLLTCMRNLRVTIEEKRNGKSS